MCALHVRQLGLGRAQLLQSSPKFRTVSVKIAAANHARAMSGVTCLLCAGLPSRARQEVLRPHGLSSLCLLGADVFTWCNCQRCLVLILVGHFLLGSCSGMCL